MDSQPSNIEEKLVPFVEGALAEADRREVLQALPSQPALNNEVRQLREAILALRTQAAHGLTYRSANPPSPEQVVDFVAQGESASRANQRLFNVGILENPELAAELEALRELEGELQGRVEAARPVPEMPAALRAAIAETYGSRPTEAPWKQALAGAIAWLSGNSRVVGATLAGVAVVAVGLGLGHVAQNSMKSQPTGSLAQVDAPQAKSPEPVKVATAPPGQVALMPDKVHPDDLPRLSRMLWQKQVSHSYRDGQIYVAASDVDRAWSALSMDEKQQAATRKLNASKVVGVIPSPPPGLGGLIGELPRGRAEKPAPTPSVAKGSMNSAAPAEVASAPVASGSAPADSAPEPEVAVQAPAAPEASRGSWGGGSVASAPERSAPPEHDPIQGSAPAAAPAPPPQPAPRTVAAAQPQPAAARSPEAAVVRNPFSAAPRTPVTSNRKDSRPGRQAAPPSASGSSASRRVEAAPVSRQSHSASASHPSAPAAVSRPEAARRPGASHHEVAAAEPHPATAIPNQMARSAPQTQMARSAPQTQVARSASQTQVARPSVAVARPAPASTRVESGRRDDLAPAKQRPRPEVAVRDNEDQVAPALQALPSHRARSNVGRTSASVARNDVAASPTPALRPASVAAPTPPADRRVAALPTPAERPATMNRVQSIQVGSSPTPVVRSMGALAARPPVVALEPSSAAAPAAAPDAEGMRPVPKLAQRATIAADSAVVPPAAATSDHFEVKAGQPFEVAMLPVAKKVVTDLVGDAKVKMERKEDGSLLVTVLPQRALTPVEIDSLRKELRKKLALKDEDTVVVRQPQ